MSKLDEWEDSYFQNELDRRQRLKMQEYARLYGVSEERLQSLYRTMYAPVQNLGYQKYGKTIWLGNAPYHEQRITDSDVVAVYEKWLRQEDRRKPDVLVIRGTRFSMAEVQAAWSRELKRRIEAKPKQEHVIHGEKDYWE